MRSRLTGADINWCVIKIDPKYIYLSDTLFSVHNAASSLSKRKGISGDLNKFRMMFSNEYNKYTSDIQAEVLVKDQIPIVDILEICFESKEDLTMVQTAFSMFEVDTSKFKIESELFGKRP